VTPDQRRLAAQAGSSAIVRLWDSLVPLTSVNSFMQTGAHPDDETSRLLARLSKRDGVRVAYACAVRGEGGQNAIGTAFHRDLGVLRTREMEAAAATLGLELYWLNEEIDGAIFDFGFSKSAEETFKIWGHERTVERLVRAIRTSRPDAIAPTFLDVGGQHGHHRANTVATIEAYRLAGDADAFPQHAREGLAPWRPTKLYLPAWSGAGGSYDDEAPPPNATISVEVGDFDPVYGATYAQFAQWSRACHRTQGMGRWVDPAPDAVPLHRLDCTRDIPLDEGGDLFAGLPHTVGDLATAGAAGEALRETQAAIDAALAAFPDNRAVAAAVHAALAALRRARKAVVDDDIAHRLAVKERQLCHASACACLLVARLTFDETELVPGATTHATLAAYNGGPVELGALQLALDLAPSWHADGVRPPPTPLAPAATTTATFEVGADAGTPPFHPYSFTTDGDPVVGRVRYVVDEVSVETVVPPEDTLALLPPVSVEATPDRLVLNLADPPAHLDVRVTAVAQDGIGKIALNVPEGWRVEPESHDETPADFRLVPPTGLPPGRSTVGVRVGSDAGSRVMRFAYPHIRPTYRVQPSEIEVLAVDVVLPDVRVGYIGGGADRVDHWLRALGVAVEPLDADALASGNLGRYDTIVVGVFAFGERSDALAALPRLHAWTEAGGTLVTLYHRPWDAWDPATVPPRFLEIGQPSLRWRVTDPDAAVKVLATDHPLLKQPNVIGADDWAGWVKERGLYFGAAWADDYVPLLAMADAGEAPLEGALLAADVGRGRHVHTALILHYQMEFLVPGAFRLLANLIAPRR